MKVENINIPEWVNQGYNKKWQPKEKLIDWDAIGLFFLAVIELIGLVVLFG